MLMEEGNGSEIEVKIKFKENNKREVERKKRENTD